MERYANPGQNCGNFHKLISGCTLYASEGNSPMSNSYVSHREAEFKQKVYLQKKCREIVEKELPKIFKEKPEDKQFISISKKRYGYSELRKSLFLSIDGCDADTLKMARNRFQKLSAMSFVRFIMEMQY